MARVVIPLYSVLALAGGLAVTGTIATKMGAQTINYSYDPAGRLTGVAYPTGVTLTYSYDPAGNLVRTLVQTPVAGALPAFPANGVVNAASYAGGAVAPGELVAIFGSGTGPASLVTESITQLGTFDNFLAGTSVLFDGVPAALVYTSAGQLSALVPYSVTAPSTQIVVQYQGRASAAVSVPVTGSVPGLFSANASGTGNGAILNQDLSVNSPSNPAARGSTIVLYGTGEGQTNPRGVDGRIAVGVYPTPLLPVSVTIGGIAAPVIYAGAAPELVAGVFQINVTAPANAPAGSVPVVVNIGTASSQNGLTVSLK